MINIIFHRRVDMTSDVFLVDWVVSYLYMFKLVCQISISYLCMFHKKEKKIHANGSPPVDQEL